MLKTDAPFRYPQSPARGSPEQLFNSSYAERSCLEHVAGRSEKMSRFETMEARIGRLIHATRQLSMIGAALKTRDSPHVDPAIMTLLTNATQSVCGEETKSLDERQVSALIRMIEMGFAEAGELLHNPARPARWEVADPVLLQKQGQASSQAFQRILMLSADRPLLQETLQGRFLDVGTGVAGIALEAAKSCPALRVDGIDIWEPALELARKNVESSPYAGRIDIKHLDVTDLAADRVYTLVWLPTMFMRRPVVEAALRRIAAASKENAYLVAARYTMPPDLDAAAFVALRTLRSGGEILADAEFADLLYAAGFTDVEFDVSPLATFTLARHP